MRILFYNFFVIIAIVAFALGTVSLSFAQTAEEVQKSIDVTTDKIKKLELEIKQSENDIEKTRTLKKTLNNLIKQLDLTRKKLETEIRITATKVDGTDLKIRQLNSEILYKENRIESYRAATTEALRIIYEYDENTLTEIALSSESFSGLWDDIEAINQFNDKMQSSTEILKGLKSELENKQELKQVEKKNLLDLKAELGDRKKITEDSKKEKSRLLVQTNNKEVAFQKLLKEKKALMEAFEKELGDYESQLRFTLDPTSIPPRGAKVFSHPLKNMFVTQYFGNTEFAKSGAYNGKGHNGVDFRASTGTKVMAALSGEVIAINTNVAYMCQYGRWVLIRHANGLTTLYAHLSLIPRNISVGQQVTTGQVIGYSGDTGYSIGPHLHFTVYASKAVEFKQYQCNGGATLTIPVSAPSGYLNPLDYL